MEEQTITLKTKLIFNSNEDRQSIIRFLELERDIFNFCSPIVYNSKSYDTLHVHKLCYYPAKTQFPQAKSQLIIKAESTCKEAYKSIRSNKHKIDKPITKKRLSCRYDQRLYTKTKTGFRLTTLSKRISADLVFYDKLKTYWDSYSHGEIVLSCKSNEVYISITFKVPVFPVKTKLALGVDLGIRRIAATSEGVLIIDKKYNKDKRKLRYLKRQLNAKKTRTAKKHLLKISRKERNRSKNFNHHVCNKILKTKANLIVIEKLNVRKIKTKRNRYQNKNRISQVALSELIRILTYKARLLNKEVVCVPPYYTSQLDSMTNELGNRKGCRFYTKNGLIYDADINAAINIAKRSHHPISYSNRILDGQGLVNNPYV